MTFAEFFSECQSRGFTLAELRRWVPPSDDLLEFIEEVGPEYELLVMQYGAVETMPKLGDTCYSVSWVPTDAVVIDESGDHDIDQAESVRVRKLFPTEAAARLFAAGVADYYGCPSIGEMEFMYWDEHSQSCMERPDWREVRSIDV